MLIKTHAKHLDMTENIFISSEGGGDKICKAKCKSFVNSAKYLGHVLSNEWVQPNPKKALALMEALCPTNIEKYHSCVGLYTYNSRFMSNFNSAFAPAPYSKKRKDCLVHKDHRACFETIKNVCSQ